jgi:uncharacterized protein
MWVLAAGAGAVAALAVAGPASAHVKASGIDAVQGSSGVVTFRVPSESTTASTTELLITFPSDTPFTSVDTQPKAGWTATITKKPLAKPVTSESGSQITAYVAQVDLKATTPSAAIPPGQFDIFNLSVGPFPKAPSVSFGALQTYSDGSTVNWDEKSADGVTEPAHPAPALQLSAANPTTTTAANGAAGQTAAAATSKTSSGTSWTGLVGLIAGILALIVSLTAFVMSRGKREPAATA